MTEILQKALQQVDVQIAHKIEKRNKLDVEIAQLQATKIGLQNALGQQVQAEIEWTELVRAVLNTSAPGEQISASQIRDTLQSWGYSFQAVRNPLAYINTVLQRLCERGELVRSRTGRPFLFGRRK